MNESQEIDGEKEVQACEICGRMPASASIVGQFTSKGPGRQTFLCNDCLKKKVKSGELKSEVFLPIGEHDSFCERATERAKQCLENAREEALRLSHHCIDLEHLLLGMLKDASGVACSVLKKLGLDFDQARREIEKRLLPPDWPCPEDEMTYTPRAGSTFKNAIEESESLQHDYIGTEHLLLSVLKEDEGLAWQVLEDLGIGYHNTRHEVIKMLGLDITAHELKDLHLESKPQEQKMFLDSGEPVDEQQRSEDQGGEPVTSNVKSRYSEEAARLLSKMQDLEEQKQDAIEKEKFELAGSLRDQLFQLSEDLDETLKYNHSVTFNYGDEQVRQFLYLLDEYVDLKEGGANDSELSDWIKLNIFKLPKLAIAKHLRKIHQPPEENDPKE